MNGKGDKPRPVDKERYEANFDKIAWQPPDVYVNTYVIVTTYNRPDYYAELMSAIVGLPGLEIHVWDDHSDVPYPKIDGVNYTRTSRNFGRAEYRQLVAQIFARARIAAWERIAMIPDDVMPAVANPFAEAERVWQSIGDPAKMLTGMLVDRRGHVPQWGSGFTPIKVGRVWFTGWNDLCWYSDERIRWHLPKTFGSPHPKAVGSGTGALWTRHLRPKGNIYNMDESLWSHRQGDSVMNPMERKIHPL